MTEVFLAFLLTCSAGMMGVDLVPAQPDVVHVSHAPSKYVRRDRAIHMRPRPGDREYELVLAHEVAHHVQFERDAAQAAMWYHFDRDRLEGEAWRVGARCLGRWTRGVR